MATGRNAEVRVFSAPTADEDEREDVVIGSMIDANGTERLTVELGGVTAAIDPGDLADAVAFVRGRSSMPGARA